jgi:hypothetical protein
MKNERTALAKLVISARKARATAPPGPIENAPFGFATRVAARWAAARSVPNWADAWERVCWWGVGASLAVCFMALVGDSLQPDPNPFDGMLDAEAEAEALDVL